MVLPPELIYEIIFHLRHDKQALLKCSLVTNLWAYSSQKLLHDWHLRFTPETFQAWKETAPSTSIEPLQHVRSLTCSSFDPLDDFHGDCQETRTPVTFFLFLFTMNALLLLPLTTFPLRVLPNRLHSPPSLVLIVASSLT